ncbi:MAG: cohesin domain-containing protein, partial [Acutalibacteraceae bacterium]
MKRVLTFFICALVLLSAVFCVVATDVPSYHIDECTAEIGNEFSVPVEITGNTGIISLRFKVVYDVETVELCEVKDCGILSGYTTPSAEISSPYTLRWADSLAEKDNNVNGTIAILKFKLKDNVKAAATDIKIEHVEARTTNGAKVSFADFSRSITIVDGHSFTNYISDNNATCTTDGTKTAKCDYCDAKDTVTDEGSMLQHTPSEAVKENEIAATCTQKGSFDLVVRCSVCNAEINREPKEIENLGHSFTNYVSNGDATCTADGTKTAKCDREDCDEADTVTDTGSKLGHTVVVDKAVSATCTKTGLTEGKHCSVCN